MWALVASFGVLVAAVAAAAQQRVLLLHAVFLALGAMGVANAVSALSSAGTWRASKSARADARALHMASAMAGAGVIVAVGFLVPVKRLSAEGDPAGEWHAWLGRLVLFALLLQGAVGALKMQALTAVVGKGVRSWAVHGAVGRALLVALFAVLFLGFCCVWQSAAVRCVLAVACAAPVAAALLTSTAAEASFEMEDPPPLDLGDRRLRVVILTVGTRGDVQPFVALGVELKSRGHTVVVATTQDFKGFVESYGLEYFDTGLAKVEQPDCWGTATSIGEMIEGSLKTFLGGYADLCSHMYEASKGADVIVATAMTVSIGLDIAEKLQIPCWASKLAPDIPTGDYAPVGFSTTRFRWFNLAKHYAYWLQVAGAANRAHLSDVENAWRKEALGLGPIGMKRMKEMGQMPALCAFSDVLVPKPRDWPNWAHLTGFWLLDGLADFAAPEHVTTFLAASEEEGRPVCVNFGSMVLVSKGGFISDVISAARACGHRVLLITGWADPPTDLPQDGSVCCVREYPHEMIFPQCLAVVHHGGAGTVARVLGAGVPQVIVPILKWADQPMYAERLVDLGVGQHVREASKATLMEAIDRATSTDSRARAVEAATRVNRENGVRQAVDLLTSCICQGIAPPGQEMSSDELELTARHCVVCHLSSPSPGGAKEAAGEVR